MLFNTDFFSIIYELLINSLTFNTIFLMNFCFFFVIPKKSKKTKKVKSPAKELISYLKKAVFNMKRKDELYRRFITNLNSEYPHLKLKIEEKEPVAPTIKTTKNSFLKETPFYKDLKKSNSEKDDWAKRV